MKIKTKILTAFLKKVRMDSSQTVEECLLKFETDGLKINANSKAQQARIMSWLKSSAFEGYEEIGNVGINDLTNVLKVVERFGETITISKEGNLLTIKESGKTVDIELVSESFLANETGEPKLEFTETATITANQLKDVFKDAAVNKDTIISITTEPKKLIFTNTGKYKFKNEIAAPSIKSELKVDFGEPLVDATAFLDGTLELSLRNNYVIRIREVTDTSVINLLIAPRVEEAA
jgi:hypothetical protein